MEVIALEEFDLQFDEYVATRWSHLVRCAVLMGVELHAAEDVVQTSLTKAYLSWERVMAAGDPEAYVLKIVMNTIRQAGRRRWSAERPSDPLPELANDEGIERLEKRLMIMGAMERLPIGQRQVVVLRYYADCSEMQTADALGLPVGTVKSRLNRALKQLARDLDQTWEDGSAT